MASQTTGTAVEITILDGPDKYYAWFSETKGSVPEDLWEFFDPEASSEFIKPQPVTFSIVKEGPQLLQQLTTAEKTLSLSSGPSITPTLPNTNDFSPSRP